MLVLGKFALYMYDDVDDDLYFINNNYIIIKANKLNANGLRLITSQ
jgi:hypothetical protein